MKEEKQCHPVGDWHAWIFNEVCRKIIKFGLSCRRNSRSCEQKWRDFQFSSNENSKFSLKEIGNLLQCASSLTSFMFIGRVHLQSNLSLHTYFESILTPFSQVKNSVKFLAKLNSENKSVKSCHSVCFVAWCEPVRGETTK